MQGTSPTTSSLQERLYSQDPHTLPKTEKHKIIHTVNLEVMASGSLTNTPEIKPDYLLKMLLKDPTYSLSSKEKIAVLIHCLQLGRIEAQKITGDEIIVALGTTGSGKSSFLNFVCGCKMERRPASEFKGSVADPIVVLSTRENGPMDEIFPLGHKTKAKTFMPQVYSKEGITYVDPPGFKDNRGSIINIANAANIKIILEKAKKVKIFILIDYPSFQSVRGKGIIETIKTCSSLLGEKLENYKDSILVGISKVPLATSEEEPQSLEKLKQLMRKTTGQDPSDLENIRVLSDRVFIFDCTGKKLRFDNAWDRERILQESESLKPIESGSNVFKVPLTSDDKEELNKICDDFQSLIEAILQKDNASREELEKAGSYFSAFKSLSVLKHESVDKLIENLGNVVTGHFNEIVRNYLRSFSNVTSTNVSVLQNRINKLQTEIKYFDESIQARIVIKDLENHYEQGNKKLKAEEFIQQLKEDEGNFYHSCQNLQLSLAKTYLTDIEAKINSFKSEFESTNVKHNISLEDLTVAYEIAQKTVREQQEKAKELMRLQKYHNRTVVKLTKCCTECCRTTRWVVCAFLVATAAIIVYSIISSE